MYSTILPETGSRLEGRRMLARASRLLAARTLAVHGHRQPGLAAASRSLAWQRMLSSSSNDDGDGSDGGKGTKPKIVAVVEDVDTMDAVWVA